MPKRERLQKGGGGVKGCNSSLPERERAKLPIVKYNIKKFECLEVE